MAREMKDSGIEWIGEIPRNWGICRLRFLCNILTGNQDTQDNDPDGKYPFYVRSPIVEKSNSFTFEGDDILMAGDGVGAGKVFHYVSGKYGCHQRVYSLQKITGISRRFLYYYLQNRFYISIETANSKSTVDSVRLNMLQDFSVTIPNCEEQQSIAVFLDTQCAHIDSVIEETRAAIEEYKKLKQSVITQAVTKGIRPNRKMKDSGIEWIGEICNHYHVFRLKNCLKQQLQYGANESGVPFDSSLPRYIRITDITLDGKLKKSDALSLPEEVANDYLLKHNDVLFARSGATVGKAFIYKIEYGKSAFAGYLIKASLNEKLLPDLLFYFTQSSIYEEWKKQIFVQATIQNIGADRYKDLPVILPPTDEQSEIVAYLDEKTAAIDSLIQKKEQLITELEAYKKSLIYEYVTGKKEIAICYNE